MDADFSVELGHDDPVLDFPWSDPAGALAYVDVKRHPELLEKIPEATRFSELAEFLRAVNSRHSPLESAKCDGWETTELEPEEEVHGAACKAAGYIDLVFTAVDERLSFPRHERFARRLTELLRRAPETLSAAEICVRRAFFVAEGAATEGCYFTIYVSGYGSDAEQARKNWGIGLRLAGSAILQMSANPL